MERLEGRKLALCAVLSVCLILALHLLTGDVKGRLTAEGDRAGPSHLEAPQTDDTRAVRELLADWPAGKPRACILILARNSDLEGVLSSVRQLERRFNAQPSARYPYIYLNDQPFTPEFRAAVSAVVAAPSFFGRVPREHWSYPAHVDKAAAAAARAAARGRMPYGGSESYRFMCRYFSGFFFDHPLLAPFDWYWRVEPGVYYFCDLPAPASDPFRHMAAHNQSLAWTIVMDEVPATIPGLWPAVQQWLAANPQLLAPDNLLPAFVEEEEEGEGEEAGSSSSEGAGRARARPGRLRYTGCHFWSNFEVGRLSFFRSAAYRSFFAHLDAGTGFFYERWGDAPVHTLAAAALLNRDQVYFARDIGYRHGSWSYCPMEPSDRPRCDCHPAWDALPLLQPHCQLDYLTRVQALASERADA